MIKRTGVVLLLFVLATIAGAQSVQKPNIIFLMIDDCSAVEFSCYATENHPAGNHTPVIDKLAKSGVQFTTCWASPLCKPTRAMLMSGKYGANTKVYGNKLNRTDNDFAKQHKPFSKVLKDNGYDTAISGKWHLPGNAGQNEYGFDEYSLLGGYFTPFEKEVVWDGLWFSWSNAAETFYDTAVIGKNNQKYPALYWNGCVIENGKLLPSDSDTFGPDLNQKFAVEYISRKRENPFFLYYPMVLPHDPWLGTPVQGKPGERTEPGIDPLITRVEYYVNELVITLKEQGLYENTIVFLTADNATLANGKGTCSELGVRVPLIVFGGPVKARGLSNIMVDFTDMYPTVCEIAGVNVANMNELDGLSFKAVLDDKPFQEKEFVFSFLDLERTVRNKDYMMDGSGGIWKCSENGNILDYKALVETAETKNIRKSFLQIIEKYELPTNDFFSGQRLESAKRNILWPSHDPATVRAVKNGDNWVNHERRTRE
ncbi:sulfatase-like hydrolase/transferase [uncultured Draconibacterium sp.]|mgnify:CR=1 FL=1|uniref:sulfatase-like hydrolase/transferase n=1 Tax=uncultured Draconibacterium sp. TaxID=1573823 RepID=UPI0025DBCE29|nr:sulfatase-like hydrolase/transferase [uncultured Draconibacterium sp.]